MRQTRPLARLAGIAAAILPFALPAHADTEIRHVASGVSSLTLSAPLLEGAGLALEGAVASVPDASPRTTPDGFTRWSFALHPDESVAFRARDGRFLGFDGAPTLAHRGGFVLGVADGRLRSAPREIALLDFSIALGSPREEGFGRLGVAGDTRQFPFEIRNAFPVLHAGGEVVVAGADVVIAPEWARAAGRPEVAGEWVGTFDLRMGSALLRVERTSGVVPDRDASTAVPGVDVLLREVYGLDDLGRIGTHPNGKLGLSFATTSCNNGSVNVPWRAPMQEDHPFIGLAMFRQRNGRMEQIGKSWVKHGFYALANNQCNLGCIGGGGGSLNVGCSDTYSISNNGSRYYLGPPEEVNPHTCIWEACGSWFDGIPVDCARSNDGSGLDGVAHRLEVWESDLLVPGAQYYYEGVYWVMDDVNRWNNWAWRQVVPTWTGSSWTFSTVGGGLIGNPGPLLYSWGDMQHEKDVAPDDGAAILATKVTDLGGGQWHYEYALYNLSSDRGIERFSVPVGTASVSAIGFRDIDRDGGNDWTVTTGDGLVTWSTYPYGSMTPSNPIWYEMLYNFWFDADAPPEDAPGRVRLHKPGAVDVVFLNTRAPYGGATAVLEPGVSRTALELFPPEPNPFAQSARLSFAAGGERPVRLAVFDVTGRLVKTLLDGAAPSGRTTLEWNGRDDTGADVASGIYFFRLTSGTESRTAKGILLR